MALLSVVDDYSRVNYQEYHLVYGEEVEAGLLFLFHAFSPKNDSTFPFQGIPKTIYMDNGPLAKSRVVRRVRKTGYRDQSSPHSKVVADTQQQERREKWNGAFAQQKKALRHYFISINLKQ